MTRPAWTHLTTDQKTEAIRPLLEEHMTASQIAGHFSGASRNAVISHIHRRMAGERRRVVKPPKPKKEAAPKRPPEPPPPKPPPAPPAAPPPAAASEPKPIAGGVPFIQAASSANLCKWPLWGDHLPHAPENWRCCGAPREGEGPYCARHASDARGKGTPAERGAVRVAEKLR